MSRLLVSYYTSGSCMLLCLACWAMWATPSRLYLLRSISSRLIQWPRVNVSQLYDLSLCAIIGRSNGARRYLGDLYHILCECNHLIEELLWIPAPVEVVVSEHGVQLHFWVFLRYLVNIPISGHYLATLTFMCLWTALFGTPQMPYWPGRVRSRALLWPPVKSPKFAAWSPPLI